MTADEIRNLLSTIEDLNSYRFKQLLNLIYSYSSDNYVDTRDELYEISEEIQKSIDEKFEEDK